MPHINTTEIRKLRDKWTAAELDPAIGERLDRAWERHQAIGEELRACTSDATIGRGAIVAKVAEGAMTVGEGVEHERAAAVRPSDRGSAENIASRARDQLLNDLVRDLQTLELAGMVEDAAGGVLAEAAKHAPSIEGVDDAAVASRGDKRCRDSWHALTLLHDRHRALVTVANALTRLGIATPALAGTPRWVIKQSEFNQLPPARQLAIIACAPPPDDLWLTQQGEYVMRRDYEKPDGMVVGR